jgi:AcrR family transcriptional regulator
MLWCLTASQIAVPSQAVSLRERQKEEGRRWIRDAASELFLVHGYIGTTMKAIATRAGVAETTLYNLFKTKPALLIEVFRDRVLGRDEQSVEVDQQRIESLTDPVEMIDLFCEINQKVASRGIPLLRVVLEAAAVDEEVADLAASQENLRYELQSYLLEALSEHGHLRTDKPYEQLQRRLWLAAAPEIVVKAVDAGWDLATYTEWLAETLQALLLRPRSN